MFFRYVIASDASGGFKATYPAPPFIVFDLVYGFSRASSRCSVHANGPISLIGAFVEVFFKGTGKRHRTGVFNIDVAIIFEDEIWDVEHNVRILCFSSPWFEIT
jgi:hypothetical protein